MLQLMSSALNNNVAMTLFCGYKMFPDRIFPSNFIVKLVMLTCLKDKKKILQEKKTKKLEDSFLGYFSIHPIPRLWN